MERVSRAGGVGPRLTCTPDPHSPGPMRHTSGPPQSRGCGVCRGCQTREDCGRCRVCLRPPRPGLRRQWRCIQRRCLRVSQAGGAGAGGPRQSSFYYYSCRCFLPAWPCPPHVFFSPPSRAHLLGPACPCLPAPCTPPPPPPSAMSATPSPSCGSPCCECPGPPSARLSRTHAFCTPRGRQAVLCLPGATEPKLSFWLSLRVNTAAAGEAATPRWLPGGAPPEPSRCLHFRPRSLQSLQSW